MKLIYIANIRVPTEKAHGLQIMKMGEAFAHQGLEVELVVPRRFNKIKENPFDYYGVEKNFKITKIFSLDLVKFGKIGFLLQSLSFVKMVCFYVLFKKADFIYSRDALPLFWLSFFKSDLFWETHNAVFNFIARRVLKKCKKIICISNGLKKFYVDNGVNPDKILVAPDGVDIEKFQVSSSKIQAREKLNLPLDKKIILYTGHLYKWKGAQVLAGASKFLDDDCLIVFVGGTEKDIKSFKFQVSSFKNIFVVGHRPHREIPLWLKAADVLVLPNSAKEKVSRFYTSPLKLFEYMASAVPIVASDLPSIREILNVGNAVLVRPDEAKSLAGGVKILLRDSGLGDRISKQAYADAAEYTWDKRSEKIIKFIIHAEQS